MSSYSCVVLWLFVGEQTGWGSVVPQAQSTLHALRLHDETAIHSQWTRHGAEHGLLRLRVLHSQSISSAFAILYPLINAVLENCSRVCLPIFQDHQDILCNSLILSSAVVVAKELNSCLTNFSDRGVDLNKTWA